MLFCTNLLRKGSAKVSESEFVAVVPVREGSQRVKSKNFRPFFKGESLLKLKVDQLKASSTISRIYISSDSSRARQLAEDYEVEFLERDPWLCSSEVRWSEVIAGVAETVPGNPYICWAHTTSPLFRDFDRAVEQFRSLNETYDSLVTVCPFQGFLLSKQGRPMNYSFGVWHDYSQDLEPLYSVTGALFIAAKANIQKWRYLIGIKPYLMEVDPTMAVDIDNEHDFRLAAEYMKALGR